MRRAQGLDKVQTVLILVSRVALGVLFGGSFSVVGIGIAWGLFVFSGAVSYAVLLSMLMIGSGLGSGAGSLLAWTRIDQIPSWTVLLLAVLIVTMVGVLGAWVGFQFGSSRDVECCVGPEFEPITYMVGGTTLLANLAALVMAVAYEIKIRRGASMTRAAAPGRAIDSPGRARHLAN